MEFSWWIAALFFPLFPFSAVFVLLSERLPKPWMKSLLFLLWPQAGVLLLLGQTGPAPSWWLYWALGTALLYAFRALVLRELNIWLSFIAISAWSVLWLIFSSEHAANLPLFALGLSLPMALLTLIGGDFVSRGMAIYSGLNGGIFESHPRLTAMFMLTLLGVIATPLFPGFFIMMSSVMSQMLVTPMLEPILLLVWLLWSWSGILLMQGLVMGPVKEDVKMPPDLNLLQTSIYSLLLLAMIVLGLSFTAMF